MLDMLNRVRWVGVMVGAAGMLLSLLALAAFDRWVVRPHIHYITTESCRNCGEVSRTWTSGKLWDRYQTLLDLSLFTAVLLALLLVLVGSLAVGRAVRSDPAMNGAVSAALAIGLALGCLLLGTLPWVLNPWVHPGMRFEKFTSLNDYGGLLCNMFPFALLSGYLGGKLGGYLGNRATNRPAS